MPLTTEETPECVNVYFRGVREMVRSETIAICEQAAAAGKTIVADLEDVPFLNSLMIGVVVLLHREAKKRQVPLQVVRVSPDVMKILKLSRLDQVLDLNDPSDTDSPPES